MHYIGYVLEINQATRKVVWDVAYKAATYRQQFLIGPWITDNLLFIIRDYIGYYFGGARGVMVIVTGYGHGDTSSIKSKLIAFHIALIRYESNYSPSGYG